MGKNAARIYDTTQHNGSIVTGFPTVLIGGKPAARISDLHTCPMFNGSVPHIGGPILEGSKTVLIGKMPASRKGDQAVCVGALDKISGYCSTVEIGGESNTEVKLSEEMNQIAKQIDILENQGNEDELTDFINTLETKNEEVQTKFNEQYLNAIRITSNSKGDAVYKKHLKDIVEYRKNYQDKLNDAIRKNLKSKGSYQAKVTESMGEEDAARAMKQECKNCEMILGFGPGPGVDQIWAKYDQNGKILEYIIVEAKGPNAELGRTQKEKQMSKKWLNHKIDQMQNKHKRIPFMSNKISKKGLSDKIRERYRTKMDQYMNDVVIGKQISNALSKGTPKVTGRIIRSVPHQGARNTTEFLSLNKGGPTIIKYN